MDMLPHILELVCMNLAQQQLPDLDLRTLRLVTKECKRSTDSGVTSLTPRDFLKPQVVHSSQTFQYHQPHSSYLSYMTCLGLTLDSRAHIYFLLDEYFPVAN